MEFDFVDYCGIGGYVGAALGAEGHLAGEIEFVGAAGVHHAEGFAEAGHEGFVDHVDDGAAVAIGLVEDFAVGEAAFVVEVDDRAEGGFRAVALFDDFVVEAFVAFFDVGVGFGELGEVLVFASFDVVHGAAVGSALVFIHFHFDAVLQVGELFAGEGGFFAVHGGAEGLEHCLLVVGYASCFGGFGQDATHGPADAVVFGFQGGGLIGVDGQGAFVLARGCGHDGAEGNGDNESVFHDVVF